ncbi:hypothetical protein [Miltoncostaea oceani]|uniref:hypothetical protein n=1 Tax=Miltoncostaea oceani TaxID=2843216 RepID=UPI001C3D86BB|nr:hypothetical protein [Miltoncostaea oceani]
MRRRVGDAGRGSATADYLGAVLAVGLMLLALTAVREHRPQRRPPIDPVAEVAALVRPAPVVRVRTPRPPGTGPPRRRGPRRPPPPRPTVLVPGWAVGW